MDEAGWVILIIWLIFLVLSMDPSDYRTVLRGIAGIVGLWLGIMFMGDSSSYLQYVGMGVLVLNIYVFFSNLL